MVFATVLNIFIFLVLHITVIAIFHHFEISGWFLIILMFVNITLGNWITFKLTGVDCVKTIFK